MCNLQFQPLCVCVFCIDTRLYVLCLDDVNVTQVKWFRKECHFYWKKFC
jgi:hypothetical protein